MRRAVILAALTAACGAPGLPLPLAGATHCGGRVYVQAGVDLACTYVDTLIAHTRDVTGVDVGSRMTVEFVSCPDWTLKDLGFPQAIGVTEGDTIAVCSQFARTIIHEALHVDDRTHDHWSKKYIGLFEQEKVFGAFRDAAEKVYCQSTAGSMETSTGQVLGWAYVCK